MNKQLDHSQGVSSSYRAYIIGSDGRIERSALIEADSDDGAASEARKPNHTRDVELWDRSRIVARFEADTGALA